MCFRPTMGIWETNDLNVGWVNYHQVFLAVVLAIKDNTA